MTVTRRGQFGLALALAAACTLPAGAQSVDRWEREVAAFEAADRASAPPRGEIVFVGSSTIRLWDLGASFPDLKTINRGIVSSEMSDAMRLVDRLVTPYAPRIVVVYAGDNDIMGITSEQITIGFERFVRAVHARAAGDADSLHRHQAQPVALEPGGPDAARQRGDREDSVNGTIGWASWTSITPCWAGTKSPVPSSMSKTASTSAPPGIRSSPRWCALTLTPAAARRRGRASQVRRQRLKQAALQFRVRTLPCLVPCDFATSPSHYSTYTVACTPSPRSRAACRRRS